jgi:hypothetical protein
MIRYRLDDLGWFHFEKLIQALLKADLGLGVQSWGGHGDLGRDAFTRARLGFPDRNIPTDGPFLFQAKFLQGANAAGAKWPPLLIEAVSREKKRITDHRKKKRWSEPRHYVLLTNAPLTAAIREKIEKEFQAMLPDAQITSLGGSDICDLLEKHPELRRSFPEILSLRDIDLLLSEAVSKPILERSRAAVEESRELIPVFVPTKAYHKAWRSLRKHSFVVLDGPPEMGKTAIARTIAIAHLFSDWQVIDCRDPNDFFSVFTDERRQIFVADDAFGRTEYDPVLGRVWERDLPRVFQYLDTRHRLIWTTRKHILIRALREMDLTGKAHKFPNPGEVIVTADELTVEEKSRILYRHSKAARLDTELKDVVKQNAISIVKHEHFTPERIRRFVIDLLPELSKTIHSGAFNTEEIRSEVREAIRNPTERMRKSFNKLEDRHKWILISILECPRFVSTDRLQHFVDAHIANISAAGFSEALDDLLGTFLKAALGLEGWIDWIHPSYRDLVIDELSSDIELQVSFLQRVSVRGVQLALSQAGGIRGEREMPLMSSAMTWNALADGCRMIARDANGSEVGALIDVLLDALRGTDVDSAVHSKILAILYEVCDIGRTQWDKRNDPIALEVLQSFLRAYRQLKPPPSLPAIQPSWESVSEKLRQDVDRGYVSDPQRVIEWGEISDIVEEFYPTRAESQEFRQGCAILNSRLFELAEEEVLNGVALADPESNQTTGRRLEQLADALAGLDPTGERDEVVSGLTNIAQQYKENGIPEENTDYDSSASDRSLDFDITGLFEDL